jgi:hypothetical protein
MDRAIRPWPTQATAATVRGVADDVTRTALADMNDAGWIHDPVGANYVGFYGPAGFGYAGMRAAVRSGDHALLRDAIRAVLVSVRERHGEPFDLWLTAKSYAWAQAHIPGEAAWVAVASEIAAYLDDPPRTGAAGRPLSALWTSDDRYSNWKLVELAAGALSTRAGRFPLSAARLARVRRIEAMAADSAAPRAPVTWFSRPARALSDPSSNPPAYSAFSAVMLRDALTENAGLVAPSLNLVRESLTDYLLAIASPDGRVAWAGRSMDLSWTAAAAMIAGTERGTRDGMGLANAAWRRLGDQFGVRDDGFLSIAPVLRDSDDDSGLDSYANSVIYGGLTAALLNDAADALETRGATSGAPPAAHRAGFLDDRRGAGLVAVRDANVWWGASVRASGDDLRYQPGLQALMVRSEDRRWVDVLPARPRVRAASSRSLWLAPDGCAWRPTGATTMRCGRTRMRLGADAGGRRLVVRISTQPNRRLHGTLYLPDAVRRTTTTLRWPTGSLRASSRLGLTYGRALLSSSTDTNLQRVDYALRADRRGRASISLGR